KIVAGGTPLSIDATTNDVLAVVQTPGDLPNFVALVDASRRRIVSRIDIHDARSVVVRASQAWVVAHPQPAQQATPVRLQLPSLAATGRRSLPRKGVLEDRPSFAIPVEIPDPPAVPRDSATVILVRDGTAGLEVFMLERHLRSDFAGGAYVFPGGTLDDRDVDPDAAPYFDGPVG